MQVLLKDLITDNLVRSSFAIMDYKRLLIANTLHWVELFPTV